MTNGRLDARGRLVLHHQDGDVQFRICDALHSVSERGALSFDLLCDADREHEYLAAPRFAVHGALAIGRLVTGATIDLPRAFTAGDPLDEPRAHFYCGEHHAPWATSIEVVRMTSNALELRGSFMIPDPTYYDDRARDTRVTFEARTRTGGAAGLWSPY